jgi:hypothetical protein
VCDLETTKILVNEDAKAPWGAIAPREKFGISAGNHCYRLLDWKWNLLIESADFIIACTFAVYTIQHVFIA